MEKIKLEKEKLFVENIELIINQLSQHTKPNWGMMTAQHMVEHLAEVLRFSNGKRQVTLMIPADKVLIYREKGLFSDTMWSENTKSLLLDREKLPALVCENFEAAKQYLFLELTDFHAYYAKNPNATHINPSFGELNYQEWKQFHYKHFRHHFTQFNLL